MDREKSSDNREAEGLDLSILWSIFKRRWIVIILAAILAGLGSGAVASLLYVPKYSASVSFLIHVDSSFTNQYQNANVNDTIVHTYEVAFKHNREFCEFLNEYAGTRDGLGYTAADVASMMSCEQILANTPTLKITFICPDPTAAYNLAESLRIHANSQLEKRFTSLSAVDVFNVPEPPTDPVTHDPFVKMFVVGFVMGALLLYAIFLIFALTDKVIHDESSMEDFSEYPILGVIPPLTGKRPAKSGKRFDR